MFAGELIFDEEALQSRLEVAERLPRGAFAAACAQRLLPCYREWCSGPAKARLDEALDEVWAALRSDSIAGLARDELESLLPEEASHWSPAAGLAENAVTAVIYATEAVTSTTPRSAVWAARQGYEAMDLAAQIRLGVDLSTPNAEEQLLQDSYVQRELFRQDSDLTELTADPTPTDRTAADVVRARAIREATKPAELLGTQAW